MVLLVAAAFWLSIASSAAGQRVQFPAQIPQGSPFSGQSAPSYGGVPTPYYAGQPTPGPPGPTAYPSQGLPATSPPVWDPYADPTVRPPTAGPYGGYAQPLPGQSAWPTTPESFTRMFQQFAVRYTWLAGDGGDDFEMHDVDLSISAALPFFAQAPLVITPGFDFHFLEGPRAGVTQDLPGQLYDAFLATSWKPQFTPWLGADLGFSIGVYSDFAFVTSDSIRLMGRGVGIVTLNPRWQVAAGVVYLDRLRVKLLPAGGLIWTPNSDARFELLFPRPKLAQRVTTIGNTDVWGYLAGEYGGGAWTVAHSDGARDEIDYNDLRLILGAEWIGMYRVHGFFEVGYVFNREILYRSGAPKFEPSDTVMLRAGLSF